MSNRINIIYDDNIVDDNFISTKNNLEGIMYLSNVFEYDFFDIRDAENINGLFFIKHSTSLYHYIKENKKLPITEYQLSKLKNSKIIFFNDTEPDISDLMEVFESFISDKGYPKNKFCIINNNSKLKTFSGNTITYNNNSFLKWSSLLMAPHETDFIVNKEMFFTCHNRVIKSHRYFMLCMLIKNNLIEFTDWSYLRGYEIKKLIVDGGILQPHYYSCLFDNFELKSFENEMKFLNEIDVKRSKYEEEYGGDIISPNYWDSFKLKVYSNSYVNIVGESMFCQNVVHISEKSLIPLFFYQIPIFLSSHHHVKYLRSRYGFDLFDDLVDHSYDNEIDNNKRFYKVFSVINEIFKNREQVISFYKSNEERFKYNRECVKKIVNDNSDYKFYIDLQNV